MRQFKNSKDGPAAYFSIRQHYLGANNVNNMATLLEAEFDSLSYSSETRRWNFEKYVGKHVELYNTAQDLIAYGYSGIDSASRVRRLMNGIKTDSLDTVKNQVMSDQGLAHNFDRTVNLFKDFLAQKKALCKPNPDSAGIASAKTTEKRPRKSRPGTDNGRNTRRRTSNVSAVDVHDRYYTPQEYARLSQDQKKALHELRKKRPNNVNQNTEQLAKALAAAVISHVDAQDPVQVDTKSERDTNGSTINNRTNPALRQRVTKRED
jgi:hypothetical protein